MELMDVHLLSLLLQCHLPQQLHSLYLCLVHLLLANRIVWDPFQQLSFVPQRKSGSYSSK